MQKPSRETLFSEWSSGSSPGLNVETCDSLALLQQLCVCVCVCVQTYTYIHIYEIFMAIITYGYTYMNEDIYG